MKDIKIITLFGNVNYGNRLQNLAVQYILQERGFHAESMAFVRGGISSFLHPMINWAKRTFLHDALAMRVHSFEQFGKKYIATNKITGSRFKLPEKVINETDYFVTGSDQVWNIDSRDPDKVDDLFDYYFLQFAEDHKKVCISPSIGGNAIPGEYEERFKKALSGFEFLSCREKKGAQEIARITGKPCEWLIDPTLYLSNEKWRQILSIRTQQKEPYIFLYFIDGINDALYKCIEKYAGDRLKIIDPSDRKSPYYHSDPADFVSVLSQAHMVFTDSFHVTAFSINFHVPFYVFDRNKLHNITSRLESVCGLFGLEDRYVSKQETFDIHDDCDFSVADRVLPVERGKFSLYLDKCFKMIDTTG